jgi:exonuclease SbcC
MKILKLKFKNINSLAGAWEINFMQPEFTENGLFAITGKTGSGKSSILDAISLALYGRTPRVDVTGSNNDVMTRGTADCFAEIEFESDGKIHKASWKQERTRTGNLKPVQRSIADSENTIIADQIKACDNKIVEILGLTFDQFTKVILLAQGSFAAFLQADKSDKGELLEQITGTEIYGEISRKIFERNKAEKEKLEQISFQLGEIKILGNEEINRIESEVSEFEKQKKLIYNELQIIETAKKWLKDLNDLQQQINDGKAKLPELLKNEDVAKAAFEKAETEVAAAQREQEKMAPVFIKVRELDTKIVEKNNLLKSVSETISEMNKEKAVLSEKFDSQNIKWIKTRDELNRREEWKTSNMRYESLVGNYSAIDNQDLQVQSRLNDWRTRQTDFDSAVTDLTIKITNCVKAEKDFNVKHQSLEAKLQELDIRKEKSADLLNGIELSVLQSEKEMITIFGNNIKLLIDNLKNIISDKREIENCEKSIVDNSVKEEKISVKNTLNKDILRNLNSQINLLRENISFAKTIQSLEEHRKNLEDGKECPLCGSQVHPFAMGNIPVTGEKEKQLQALNKQFENIENTLQTDEKALAKAMIDKKNADNYKQLLENSVLENRAKNREILLEISDLNVDIREDAACLEKLEEIRNEKLKNWRQMDAIIKNVNQIEAEIKRLREEIIPQYQQAEKSSETAKNECETAKKLAEKTKETSENLANQAKMQYETEKAALLSKLAEYGVASIEELKKCLNLWLENEESVQKLSRQKIELEGNIGTTKSLIETNQKQFAAKNTEKEQIETAKNELVTERNTLFGDKKTDNEEIRLKKWLNDAEAAKKTAEKAKNEANTELAKTNAVVRESESRLLAKQAEKRTEKTPEELQAEYDQKKLQSDELSQKIGANKQALEVNNENLEKNEKKLTEKERQQEESEKWKRLDHLIGSADGKKYRNFAQALTFENLIMLANRQLQKMSERYILKRLGDIANPFELSVIDKFQNCDERTAQNLSGGEKFIVSLALALGLANMASRNMKIDTMFIDEGFGTLDSDYLNVALTALSNLQSEGKLIGVISHLAELKERIITHIEVTPKGDGYSKIEIV